MAYGFSEASKPAFGVGFSFTTGNSTVRRLRPGTKLVVNPSGGLTITEMPQLSLKPGDRIRTKYGPSTVVRITTRGDLDEVVGEALGEGNVIYVADGAPVLRFAPLSAVEAL